MTLHAAVVLCGLYQGQVDACLELTDRAASVSHAACETRAKELARAAQAAFRLARVRAPLTIRSRCIAR